MIGAWLAARAFCGLVAGDHQGQLDASGIAWSSLLAVDGAEPLSLATPLPRAQVVGVGGARPRWDGDRLVGLDPDADLVQLTTRQVGDGLRPPLILAPDALQEIGVEGHAWDPDAAAGVERRIGGWASPSVGRIERQRARFALRAVGGDRGEIVVRVDHPLPEGLPGELRPVGAVSGVVMGGAALVAGGLVVGGVVGHRRLESWARRERIHAYFADRAAAGERTVPE